MGAPSVPFWSRKAVGEFTPEEWESLCDHCGKCCVHRLEDRDTGELFFTNVACRYLDQDTCRCSEYERRAELVGHCVALAPNNLAETARWLSASCAYRRLAEGKGLPAWHPLISGREETVRQSGQSVCGRVVSEDEIADELQHHLVEWW